MAKRVLFIIYSFSYGGGAEKVLSYLIGGLDKRGGYEMDLLEVQHGGIAWEPLPESVTVLPPVLDETATAPLARLRRGVLRRVRDLSPTLLRRLVRTSKHYDLVVAFNYMLPSLLIKPGEASISWNHGSIECLQDTPREHEWQRHAYGNATKVVAIAERTAQSILDQYPEVADKLCVIHNGFPIDAIRAAAEDADVARLEQPAFLCVGRLDENKNPLGVLSTFANILEYAPDAHLYYLGHGELEGAVLTRADNLGIAGRVHMLGYVENPYPLIKQACCILSLSHAEGFQSVFVEGLALGVPFISPDAGAARELVCACGGGQVIADPSEGADAWCTLCAKVQDSSFVERLCRYADGLSVDAFVDAFETVASEVLGGRP